MSISAETLLVASLMMAVFAAVSAVGSSLFLGAGFERLRAGFETIKKQTAFFSDSIHQLDQRVESVEKQGQYYFEAITNLEEKQAQPQAASENAETPVAEDAEAPSYIQVSKDDAPRADMLTEGGYSMGQDSLRFH